MQTLKRIAPEHFKASQKRLKTDARPMVAEAKKNIPAQPLSRWKAPKQDAAGGGLIERAGSSRMPAWTGAKAKRSVGLSLKNQKIKGSQARVTFFRMIAKDASAAVFDMAGRRTRNQFADNLASKYGTASRFMWPAAEKHLPTVRKSIERARDDMEDIINAELRTRGGSRTRR